MKWLKKSVLLLLAFSFFSASVFSADISPAAAAREAIASMRADLQLLNISIANYEKKIGELRNIIEQSQDDLTAQKALLTDSEKKLAELKTQYSDLNETYQYLSKQYKRSSAIIKYGGITAIAIIAAQGIIIAIK